MGDRCLPGVLVLEMSNIDVSETAGNPGNEEGETK